MALIEFNYDVGGRHPWEVLNTQKSEVKTPYCKVVVDERRLEHTVQDQIEISK
jgi:hypothetical protein